MTEYRDIPGLPGYCAGSDGSVWSRKRQGPGDHLNPTWHQLTPTKKRSGYLNVTVRTGGLKLTKRVHRLILEAFVGPCPTGMQACHNDGDRANNATANLRWDSCVANQADRSRHGRTCRGSRSPKAKLTEDEVQQILRRSLSGESATAIAREKGLHKKTVQWIVNRKGWRHVTALQPPEEGS